MNEPFGYEINGLGIIIKEVTRVYLSFNSLLKIMGEVKILLSDQKQIVIFVYWLVHRRNLLLFEQIKNCRSQSVDALRNRQFKS